MVTLNMLQEGERAKIVGLDDHILSVQLMELGFLPGEYLSITGHAPFGDPMRLNISGAELCIRSKDAKLVLVERL